PRGGLRPLRPREPAAHAAVLRRPVADLGLRPPGLLPPRHDRPALRDVPRGARRGHRPDRGAPLRGRGLGVLREILLQSLTNLRRNRVRSLLTMLGIVWGIVAVSVLMAYGS